MSTVIAGANLNFGRSRAAQLEDIAELEANADIICTQEDVTGKNRERIRVAKHVQRDHRGSILAGLSRFGYKIGWRHIRWVDVDLPGIDMVRVFAHHEAPRRMPLLQRANDWRLRRALRRSPHPWIVEADWNHFTDRDPCELHKRLHAHWFGHRIDGFAVHPELVEHVIDFRFVARPKRHDGHSFAYLTLA